MKRLLFKLALWALHRLLAKRLGRPFRRLPLYRRPRKSGLKRLLDWLG
ncbi:MAG: hypothetical protein RMI80_07320 [Meiothermus sp.]|nr:hypothetical protein [Meiothermus sp.]